MHRPDVKCRVNVIHAGYRLAGRRDKRSRAAAADDARRRIRFEKIVRSPGLCPKLSVRVHGLLPPLNCGREIKSSQRLLPFTRESESEKESERKRDASTRARPPPFSTHRWGAGSDQIGLFSLFFFCLQPSHTHAHTHSPFRLVPLHPFSSSRVNRANCSIRYGSLSLSLVRACNPALRLQ